MMRLLLSYGLAVVLSGLGSLAAGEGPKHADRVVSTLTFRDDFKSTREIQHLLTVNLRLEAKNGLLPDDDHNLVCEADLLDADGKVVAVAPPDPKRGPGGSRCGGPGSPSAVAGITVSTDFYAFAAPTAGNYALVIGKRGWLIPLKSLGDYSVRLRAWTPGTPEDPVRRLRYEVPATKITLTK